MHSKSLSSIAVITFGISLSLVGCASQTSEDERSLSSALQTETCAADGQCSTCNDAWVWLDRQDVPSPAPSPTASPVPAVDTAQVRPLSDPVTVITAEAVIDAAGTATIREITISPRGAVTVVRVISTIPNAVRGGMAVDAIFRNLASQGIKVIRIGSCAGVLMWALFAGQMAYAGMEYALGPAAEQMGIRGEKCADRVAKAVKGIACLRTQSGTCQEAAKNCSDAFFGPLLETDCALESEAARQQVAGLYGELAGAIEAGSTLKGGAGFLPTKRQELLDALKDVTKFQSDASMMCRMRDMVYGEGGDPKCSVVPGSIYSSAPGVLEAKKCWDDAGGLGWGWRIDRAKACCTTDACRQLLNGLNQCW